MWALTCRPIQNAEALQLMERYKAHNALQSNQWLLPRHLACFAVRPLYPAQLVLPTSSVIQLPLSAVPFSSLPLSRKRKVLGMCPPPCTPPGSCSLLECSGAAMRWRPASLSECFDAAFVCSDSPSSHQHLLCATDCAGSVTVAEEVTVFNAQETNNPFLVDAELAHRNLLTKETYQHSIGSSLTTIAAQFRYTSFDWVEATAAAAAGLRVRSSAAPHLVNCVDTLRVVHISQLRYTRQQELVAKIPRMTLIKSMTISYIFYHKRWRHHKSMELMRPLLHRNVPCCGTPQAQALQPLLWIAVDLHMEFRGPVTECARHSRKQFYNSQQLEAGTCAVPSRS
ncbi:conserved hypothetical protein [Leishmania infantum JPCM5]|uniref:Trypanosoma Tc-38 (p38) protein domain-containing protein n=2 Tax=Leishmania infantum TaxID=5671 RepID=E9AH18_LEIIN|nr:conserved hypothetical protein [Leishmania infantum JPCM5]CAC9490450.1 hypothetical_protein_-_conserved [Leishmania infantum]CBZ08687.1 conserved hypothetical protein [Leishmania infantum JPCM5]SUZ42077.1 hypothetical_protein_-_conserved [Leishmania infantum]|eukprot:XP_003392519.1 conserved hypothetical protein [Leishmania infantum JPCM5]